MTAHLFRFVFTTCIIFIPAEFQSVDELLTCVRGTYGDVVNGQTELIAGSHMITNLVLHFHQTNHSAQQQVWRVVIEAGDTEGGKWWERRRIPKQC